MPPDPKPPARVRDPALLRSLHMEWGECALCGSTRTLSLHHVHKHPRDDVRANLVMLCGSGTTGCHGMIEHHAPVVCHDLAVYLLAFRPDTIDYLVGKLGSTDAAREWMRDSLHAAP